MVRSKSKTDLRLEMRVKNNLLWHAIHDLHPTVAAFCRVHKLHQTEVGKLLSFKTSPFTKKGEWRTLALRLSAIIGITTNELFPAKVYEKVLEAGSSRVAEVSSFAALPGAVRREIRLLPAPVEQCPDVSCSQAERKKAIIRVLRTLPYMESEVLKLRFGLGGDSRGYTLEEVGDIFKLSSERIRQIEAMAIRKLQQPERSQILVGFLD